MATTQPPVTSTSKLYIPTTYLPTIYDKVKAESVIASLIPQTPQLYTNDEMIYVTGRPKTEVVGEGGKKGSTSFGTDTRPMKKFKLQTTIRTTEEVEIADEDSSIDLLDFFLDQMTGSLGEGIDAVALHNINPKTAAVMTGDISAASVAIAPNGTQVTATTDLIADIDNLPDSVAPYFNINGIALDNMFANEIRKTRNPKTGAKEYPGIPLGLNVTNFEGMNAVTSANVSGRPFTTDTGAKAILGDWTMARWGVIREMVLRRFDVGDPDGRGYDLSEANEIAFRVEMIFAFGTVYPDAFAVLTSNAEDEDEGGGDEGGGDTPSVQSTKASK